MEILRVLEGERDPIKQAEARGRAQMLRIVEFLPKEIDNLMKELEKQEEIDNLRKEGTRNG